MNRLALSVLLLALSAGCNLEPKRRSRPDTAPATLAHAVSYDAPNYLRRVGVICEVAGEPKTPRIILDASEGRGRYMARILVEERVAPRRIRPAEHIEARMEQPWPTGHYATKFDELAIELSIDKAAEPPEKGRAWVGKARFTRDEAMRPAVCKVVGE